MAQGNKQGTDFANFGDDQGAGIVHVVGVAHMEKVAAAVKVTNGGGEFRAWHRFGASAAGGSWFALRVHFYIPLALLQCIVNKLKLLKNMAKVIGLCGMKNPRPASLERPSPTAAA